MCPLYYSIMVRVDHICGDWFAVLIIAEGMYCIFHGFWKLESVPHKAKHFRLECSGCLVQTNDTTISMAFGNGCVISLYKPTLQPKVLGFVWCYLCTLSHCLFPYGMDTQPE